MGKPKFERPPTTNAHGIQLNFWDIMEWHIEKLYPCKHCGEKDLMYETLDIGYERNYKVVCLRCRHDPFSGPRAMKNTIRKARMLWNKYSDES